MGIKLNFRPQTKGLGTIVNITVRFVAKRIFILKQRCKDSSLRNFVSGQHLPGNTRFIINVAFLKHYGLD